MQGIRQRLEEFGLPRIIIALHKENTLKYIGELPDSILSIILSTSTYNGIEVTKEDKITLIKAEEKKI